MFRSVSLQTEYFMWTDSMGSNLDVGSDSLQSLESSTVMGGRDLVIRDSNYIVPLQLSQQSMPPPVPPQGKSAADDYHYLPMYETACKFAKSTGEEGC